MVVNVVSSSLQSLSTYFTKKTENKHRLPRAATAVCEKAGKNKTSTKKNSEK